MALARESSDGFCTARDCNERAVWRIDWSNPQLAQPRTKTWFSCATHEQYFRNYFSYRSFPATFTLIEQR